MLSKKEIICPEKLLELAKAKGPVKVVIVNAGKQIAIDSAKQGVEEADTQEAHCFYWKRGGRSEGRRGGKIQWPTRSDPHSEC